MKAASVVKNIPPVPVKRFVIKRTYLPNGTRGKLYDATGNLVCLTIERPRDGEYPCIPEGSYVAELYNSPKHGPDTWQLMDVPGRTNIQIHVANFPHELLGCIAPGLGELTGEDDEPGVSQSRVAYGRFWLLTCMEQHIMITFEEDKK